MSAHERILTLLQEYFRGLHTGDVACLRSVFHPSAVLWGEVKGQPYHRALPSYLEIVRGRASPASLGDAFSMRVVSLAVEGSVAIAQVRCPMLGFSYVDFLSLCEQDGRWSIVAKVFTHVEPAPLPA